MYMSRWVELKGNRVEFGNIVGGFCGRPYVYECASAEDAFAFSKFLEHRDPAEPNMPVAVTDAELVRFNAARAAATPAASKAGAQ